MADRYAGQKNALIDVPKSGSFADTVEWMGKPNIGKEMDKIIAKLVDSKGLRGIIDVAPLCYPDNLGSGKDTVDRILNLIVICENPNLNFD